MSHARLLHNLRKRRIDPKVVSWIESSLKTRSTTLSFSDTNTDLFEISKDIPQESPLSPILYLFYNADLLDACNDPTINATPTGYIDDANILVHSDMTEENCQKLAEPHTHCDAWAKKHASKFAPAKYELVYFSRSPRWFNLRSPLVLPNGTHIKPKDTCRYLGIILDTKLRWKANLKHIQAKAVGRLNAMACLAGSTWGRSLIHMRLLYLATVLPYLLYACSVWYAPHGE